MTYVGPLAMMTVTVYGPEGLPQWRLRRRLGRAEKTLLRGGARRVVLPEGFPYAQLLTGLRPVETLPFYRAIADVLALGALECQGVPPERGRVALSAPWLCPELMSTAERLCRRVRGLLIDVPGEGEEYARWLHGQYGLPVTPPPAGAEVTVAFGPGGRRWGQVLELHSGQAELGNLAVTAPGWELPGGCGDQILALLWELGAVSRDGLATKCVSSS